MLKKILFALTPIALVLQNLSANSNCWIGGGWRQDSLTWTIAGPNDFPNVLSELEWHDVRMAEVDFGIEGEAYECIYYRLSGNYAKIYDGKNRDSDFAGNDRTLLFSQTDNKADQGEAYGYSIGLGYPIPICWDCLDGLTIVPLVGYSYDVQHFRIRDGFQTFEIDGNVGPFPGLDSKYDTEWNSGWLGFDFAYACTCEWAIFGSFEYHFAHYSGEGHWNLRPDFVGNFEHKGYGNGPSFLLGAEYQVDRGIGVALTANYRFMQVKNGTDRTHFLAPLFDPFGRVVGEELVAAETRLNEVNWHSFRLIASLTYEF